MLTTEGITWLAGLAVGTEEDPLLGGTVTVTDGENRATASIAEARLEDTGFLVVAVFDEEQANFNWMVSEIRTQGGTVIDSTTEDGGRKAQGSVWTVQTLIELRPAFDDLG